MRVKNLIMAGVLILIFSVAASSKDFMYLLRFDKGEMFGDFNQAEAGVNITKKNTPEGKIGLKLKYAGKKGTWIGEWKPTRRKWDDFTKISFYIFNEEKEERTIIFRVKGAKNPVNTPENTVEVTIKLPVGVSEHTIDIANTLCQDGKSKLDLTAIAGYSFVSIEENPLTIDISELKLLK